MQKCLKRSPQYPHEAYCLPQQQKNITAMGLFIVRVPLGIKIIYSLLDTSCTLVPDACSLATQNLFTLCCTEPVPDISMCAPELPHNDNNRM